MVRRISNTILILGIFLGSAVLGAGQMAPIPKTGAGHAGAESNPACRRIVNECRRLGFVQGQWKQDNGLWRDCVDPVVKGGTPTRDGKPINVPVSANDVRACRAAVGHHR